MSVIPEGMLKAAVDATHPTTGQFAILRDGLEAALQWLEKNPDGRIAALEAQNKRQREVLTIMHEAMDDKKGGTWIKARKWLDERNIYHGDLQENAVLAEVCRAALAATEPKP